MDLKSQPIDVDASKYDLAVIVTDHTQFDYERITRAAPATFDTRNATRGLPASAGKIVRL